MTSQGLAPIPGVQFPRVGGVTLPRTSVLRADPRHRPPRADSTRRPHDGRCGRGRHGANGDPASGAGGGTELRRLPGRARRTAARPVGRRGSGAQGRHGDEPAPGRGRHGRPGSLGRGRRRHRGAERPPNVRPRRPGRPSAALRPSVRRLGLRPSGPQPRRPLPSVWPLSVRPSSRPPNRPPPSVQPSRLLPVGPRPSRRLPRRPQRSVRRRGVARRRGGAQAAQQEQAAVDDSASAGVRQASNSGPGSANSGSSGEG